MLKKIAVPTLSLFIICAVSAVLLALTNTATKDKIQQMESANAAASQSKVMESADDFKDEKAELNGKEYTYQLALDKQGNILGYVFTTAANGYGGQVKVMTGVNADGTVNKIEILDVSGETPGLGQNAKNEGFFSQFASKSAGIGVTKGEASGNEIKAMTGATITSNAVTKAVNEALSVYKSIQGGEQ